MKLMLMGLMVLTYLALWNVCDFCIMYATAASCGITLLGGSFMFSPCWIGIIATLLKGFRIGSTDAHVDVKWTL